MIAERKRAVAEGPIGRIGKTSVAVAFREFRWADDPKPPRSITSCRQYAGTAAILPFLSVGKSR